MTGLTALVTGAAGFIGQRMLATLQEQGWRTIGLDQDTFRGPAPEAEGPGQPGWIVADITSEAPIELPAGIDVIFHLAGKAHALSEVAQDEGEYFQINTEGTRRMLEAAQRVGVRSFVLFSTVKAVGEPTPEAGRGRPIDEGCCADPNTPYGRSKREAEILVLEGSYVPHTAVLRPSLVYGPSPKGNLSKMIEAVRCGRFPPLPEVGNRRSMVHIDDVIAAAILVAEHPKAAGQTFILADDLPFSTRQLFEWICKALGRPVPDWSVPLWVMRGLGGAGDAIGWLRRRRFVFDSDALEKLIGNAWYSSAKIKRELGWKPMHTLRESLPDILRSSACQ